jgi:hypothetical protein
MQWEIRPAAAAAAVLASLALTSARGRAQAACGTAEHAWVQVRASPEGSPSFESLLRAELASRRIDLCSEPGSHSAPAIATVEIARREGATAIVVQVRDAVTAKRVERDLDLDAIPKDGQPLALALAADELLRASWAELALSTAPPPAAPIPSAVTDTVDASVKTPRRAPRGAFGALATIEHYSAGQTLYGADLQASLWVTRRLSAGARLGLRSALSASAPDGEVRASAFVAGLEAAVTATPPAWSWGLDALLRFDLERVSYLAVPNAGASAPGGAATAFLAGAGARLSWSVAGSIRLIAEALAEVPVRPVEATDSGGGVVGLEGVGVQGALGARAVF